MENRYPENIMKVLRQRLDLDAKDTSKDREINIMTPNEVFEAVLEWYGIIGYGDRIRYWLEDIYGIDFNAINETQHTKIEYNPTIETLICITEEVATVLATPIYKKFAERIFEKKEQNAESIQEFYQRYIDWANEFEEAWVQNGEEYEGNCDFFEAVAEFTRKKLEEYAGYNSEYEVSMRFCVTAANEDEAIRSVVEEIKNGNTDNKMSVRMIN